MNIIRAILAVCIMLVPFTLVRAEPGRGKAELSSQPKRSYGAIDVIMYQTSW